MGWHPRPFTLSLLTFPLPRGGVGGEGMAQSQTDCVHVPTLPGPGLRTMPESLLLCPLLGRLIGGQMCAPRKQCVSGTTSSLTPGPYRCEV